MEGGDSTIKRTGVFHLAYGCKVLFYEGYYGNNTHIFSHQGLVWGRNRTKIEWVNKGLVELLLNPNFEHYSRIMFLN